MCLPTKCDQRSSPAGQGERSVPGPGGRSSRRPPELQEPDLAHEARAHAAREDSSDPKSVIRRMIDEVMNGGRLDVIDELYSPQMARAARRWITPFRESFADVEMEIVDLIAEGEEVVGRFRCSATNLGPWRGRPPTGRRFERVDEVYIFRVRDGAIIEAWGIEDTRVRERQLGLSPSSPDTPGGFC